MRRSWFLSRLSLAGRRTEQLAGETAVYCRGGNRLVVTVNPIQQQPEEMEPGQIRADNQTFVIKVNELLINGVFLIPKQGDRIIWNGSTYSVCGGSDSRNRTVPAWRYTTSLMDRIVVFTNRIKGEEV